MYKTLTDLFRVHHIKLGFHPLLIVFIMKLAYLLYIQSLGCIILVNNTIMYSVSMYNNKFYSIFATWCMCLYCFCYVILWCMCLFKARTITCDSYCDDLSLICMVPAACMQGFSFLLFSCSNSICVLSRAACTIIQQCCWLIVSS